MSETPLFGMKSKCNNVYSLLQVFQTLLLYPCFMIRNPYNYEGSCLRSLMDWKKDVFYRFMNNSSIDWRKLLYHLNLQLWSKIRVRSDHKSENTCLIGDDTDYPKTGRRTENIGRVHSHVQNRCILGFTALFLAITDGKSQLILDFAILGEKGKNTYVFERKYFTAPALIKLLVKRGHKKYSRKLHCYYTTADVTFADTLVRPFLVKRSKSGVWNGLTGNDIYKAIINRSEEINHICDIYKLKFIS